MSSERERQMKKATYEYCKQKGICVVCRKEEAFYNHVLCPSCMEKRAQYRADKRANMTQEERELKNAKRRERYHRYKAEGRCVNCGGKAMETNALCQKCYIQSSRAHEAYHIRTGRKKCYEERGLCIRCGGDRVEGYKLCPECLEKNREMMAYARQFSPTGSWLHK